MTVFAPNLDILPDAQKNLWSSLSAITEKGFTLYGGTAIALRLGHRESVDFDFFTEFAVDADDLVQSLALLKTARPLQVSLNTYTAIVDDPTTGAGVKFSFFGGLQMGRVGAPDWTDDGILRVASPLDLLATKLKVILQRIEWKDYIDIVALTSAGVPLAEGLAAAAALYPQTFPPSQSLKALTWFEEGDLHRLSAADRAHLLTLSTNVRVLPEIARISDTLGSDVRNPNDDPPHP